MGRRVTGDRRPGRWCRTPRLARHPRRARCLMARRAALISRSMSARVNASEPVSAERVRMARTALRARANTSSWMSSSKVASLVGTMMLRGTPSFVITTAPSRSRSAQTWPGRAASVRDAIVFMHYIYMIHRSASREQIHVRRPQRAAWTCMVGRQPLNGILTEVCPSLHADLVDGVRAKSTPGRAAGGAGLAGHAQ